MVNYGDLGSGWVFAPSTDPIVSDGGPGMNAAWGDYDNDGDLDVYLTNQLAPNKLLQNNHGSGFYDVTGTGSLADPGNSQCSAWGDYDNDGLLDLYIVNSGQADCLLRNTGSGFIQIVDAPLGDTGHGRSVTWMDYDNDADLDLFVSRYGNVSLYFRTGRRTSFSSRLLKNSAC